MMIRLLLLLIFSVTAVNQASAQRTGTRVGRDATAKDGARALEIIAACVAARRPEFARRWLDILPGAPEEAALLKRETEDLGLCMESDALVLDGKEVAFQPRMLRRPLASAMVSRMLSRAPSRSPLPADSAPWFATKLAAVPPGGKIDRTMLGIHDFGHCVAVNQWAGTLALLASEPDSPQQATAIKLLTPALGPCLTEGANITLTPANLRVVLAEPVYHLLKPGAASVPAGAR